MYRLWTHLEYKELMEKNFNKRNNHDMVIYSYENVIVPEVYDWIPSNLSQLFGCIFFEELYKLSLNDVGKNKYEFVNSYGGLKNGE